mgnify:CR=1 FL=1
MPERDAVWVEQRDPPSLVATRIDVGPTLAARLFSQRTVVLASATLAVGNDFAPVAWRIGIRPEDLRSEFAGEDEQAPEHPERYRALDVGSPFDYEANALLYCGVHLPDPRTAAFGPAVHDELVALINAAGGRTLALFTSYKAMDAAAEAVRARVEFPIITQRDMPKAALVRAFSDDEHTCLFATSGFFQGVDIPGRTLSLVVIDKIPFPRPDDPLLSARRELLGPAAFGQIDIPRASMLPAQATGRLIRTANDRGVVAVMDPRLGTANYRWEIVKALPPMKRTRHRSEAEEFLRKITG